MMIRVRMTGALRRPADPEEKSLKMARGATIEDLLEALSFDPSHRKFINATVNEKSVRQWHGLNENDLVTLFLPVGGG